MNKKNEIKRIKEAKKNGSIYISPLVFGDNALAIQGILNGLINKNNHINLNNKGGGDVK